MPLIPGSGQGQVHLSVFMIWHPKCMTELVVFPFAVMDVTLRQYLSLTPGEALDHIKKSGAAGEAGGRNICEPVA